MVQTLASVFGLSLLSGVNLYAAVLTVGLGQRFGFLTGLPESLHVLGNPIVLSIAGILYLVEFFADKIPFITPIWDAIHTFIRPLGAALLAFEASGNLTPAAQAASVLIGGSLALGAHSTKAGFRLMAHTVPEPTTHSTISILEDFGVVSGLLLIYKYPAIAVPVLIALLVLFGFLLVWVFRALRAVGRKITSWLFPKADSPKLATGRR